MDHKDLIIIAQSSAHDAARLSAAGLGEFEELHDRVFSSVIGKIAAGRSEGNADRAKRGGVEHQSAPPPALTRVRERIDSLSKDEQDVLRVKWGEVGLPKLEELSEAGCEQVLGLIELVRQ